MERYISIDNAIKIVTKAMECGEYKKLIDVSNALYEAPAADVVPREEADKYFAECKHLQEMLEAATAGQETLQKETSKWVKECEELQERLIEYEKDLARQIFGKIEKIIGEKYSFFVHKSEYDEEVEAIINFSDSISNDIDDLKEKYIGDGEGADHE